MKPFKFLQISDVHIDSKLSHSQIDLPAEKRQIRINEISNIIPKMCQLARDAEVDAVLIPGDLWDDECISAESVNRLTEGLATISPTPIFIAPGNHDFYSPASMYNRDAQRARAMRIWPANVFIFTTAHFVTLRHPKRDDVSITGRAFRENVTVQTRFLKERFNSSPADISLLLFHGSLDDRTFEEKGKMTAPFSSSELLNQNFSYAAIGHYHQFRTIKDRTGQIRGAYAGCPAGRTSTETGPRYVLVGEFNAKGRISELRTVQLDERVIHRVQVDVSGTSQEQIIKQIGEALPEDQTKPCDIVCVCLTGRLPYGANPSSLEAHFADKYFHFKIVDRTVPSYDLETFDPRTIQGRFARELDRRMASATTVEEQTQLREALYYGLDALIQKEVKIRHED